VKVFFQLTLLLKQWIVRWVNNLWLRKGLTRDKRKQVVLKLSEMRDARRLFNLKLTKANNFDDKPKMTTINVPKAEMTESITQMTGVRKERRGNTILYFAHTNTKS
jgi:hypothetical protein